VLLLLDEERRRFFYNVALGLEALVLGAEAQPLLDGREVAPAEEGLVALGLEGLLPGAEEGLVDAEGACRLGDEVALLGDELDGLGLELGGVGALGSCHAGPPRGSLHP
jgi:hypothetical protein